MKKLVFIILFTVLLFIIGLFAKVILIINVPDKQNQSTANIIIIENDKVLGRFQVELADSSIKQAIGLMFRESMAANKGMLFIFDQEQASSFWMKNTKVPLDMIFFSKDKKVLDIISQAKPCYKDSCPTYNSSKNSKYVLEVNGGLAEKLNISTSSAFIFDQN